MTSDGELLVREHPDTEPVLDNIRSHGYHIDIPALPNATAWMPEQVALDILDEPGGTVVGSVHISFEFFIKGRRRQRHIECDVDTVEVGSKLLTDGGEPVEEDELTTFDAREVLHDAYGDASTDEAVEVTDIADFHDMTVSFLALYDQHTDDEGTLPDDLDAETKRQLSTAQTLLTRALSGMERTARDRLNALDETTTAADPEDADDERDSTGGIDEEDDPELGGEK